MFGLFKKTEKFPRLVRFNSGKYGVEIEPDEYLDLRDRHNTSDLARGLVMYVGSASDAKIVVDYCEGTEQEARAALAAYPFPATPVSDSNTNEPSPPY